MLITNFAKGTVRTRIGDANSGQANLLTSWGYDPYTKPNVLQWTEAVSNITGANIADTVLHMLNRIEGSTNYIYAIGYAGKFYKITASSDAVSLLASTALNLKYGGGMAFVSNGTTERVLIGHDAGLSRVDVDGTNLTSITGPTWITNIPRPVVQFASTGFFYIGNDTNIAEFQASTNTITTNAKLGTALPANMHIIDMSMTSDGRYLKILCSRIPVQDLQTADDTSIAASVDTKVFYWNGTDTVVSSEDPYPSLSVTGLYTSGTQEILTGYDFEGAFIKTQNIKYTLPKSKAPLGSAMDASGEVVVAGCIGVNTAGTAMNSQIFVFGTQDSEIGGFHKLLSYAPQGTNTSVTVIGSVKIIRNLLYKSDGTNLTQGTIYFSTYEAGGTPAAKLYKFLFTPLSGTPSLGVYETQTQVFPKKQKVSRINIYCETTVSGAGFQVDLIGPSGTVITNSTFTYTFATTGVDRVIFVPAMDRMYALGVRITNTGTANMVIHMINIETTESEI